MAQGAGWYDDGSGTTRWWDGAAWTEHVLPEVTPSQPQSPFGAPAQAPHTPVQEPHTPVQASHPPVQAPRKSARKLWIILSAAVAALALLAVGIILVVRPLDPGPQEAVGIYYDAVIEGDCDKMAQVVDEDLWHCENVIVHARSLEDDLEGGAQGFSYVITSTERVNDEATVVTEATYVPDDSDLDTVVSVETFQLRLTDGAWKIWESTRE